MKAASCVYLGYVCLIEICWQMLIKKKRKTNEVSKRDKLFLYIEEKNMLHFTLCKDKTKNIEEMILLSSE